MKKGICLLLVVLLLAALSSPAYAASEKAGTKPGQLMPDFTVSLTDGTTATLSALLQEKDLVVLNVFTTWCGPCEREFPDFEMSYTAHSDRMLILSVSGDPNDTMEMVADYKAGHGLSFPMGQAGEALSFLKVSSYPTTYFITRGGRISFLKVGAFVNEGDFEQKVSTLLSPDYDGRILPTERALPLSEIITAAFIISTLLTVIGRWGLFRKAGKPGWLSLIPIVSNCREYALCWKGWLGFITIPCQIIAVFFFLFFDHSLGIVLFRSALLLLCLVLSLAENLKLAKAYGKKPAVGVLLFLFREPARVWLGLGKAAYAGK